MKLGVEEIKKLYDILTTCAIGNINSIIIEDNKIRGINDEHTCVILSDYKVPSFSQKIGLTRVNSLKSLIDIFIDNPQIVLDAKETDRGEISQLEIVAGKNKGQFRCTSASTIKAPKSISDPAAFLITVSKDELTKIFQGIKVKNAKKVSVSIMKTGEVSFQMSDANYDNLKFEIESAVESLTDEEHDSITHYYATDVLMNLVRKASEDGDVTLSIGEGGTMTIIVNGHCMTIMPQVGEEE